LTPSAREALFEELTRLSRDRIFTMFRASPKLFGISDSPGGGADKVQDARREFDTYVIRPFMNKLQARITDELTDAWAVDYKIDYRYVMPLEELVRNAGTIATLPGVKVREVREFLAPLGWPESTGDTTIDETVLNLPGENLNANGQGGFPDRGLPAEPGRPPLGQNTKAFPKAGTAMPKGAAATRGTKAMIGDWQNAVALAEQREALKPESKAVVLEDPAPVRVGKLPGEKAPEDRFANIRDHDVTIVASTIQMALNDAARVLERGLLDHAEGKAFKPNNLRSRLRSSESWKTFSAMVEQALDAGVKKALSFAVMQQDRLGVRADEELDYDAIAKGIVHRPEAARGIVRTLKERVLRGVAAELEKDGTNVESVRSSIQNEILTWQRNQTPMIGANEAVVSYNEGTLTVFEAVGTEFVFVTDGNDHDEPCREADGSVWSLDQARENLCEHPNCRRAFLLLPNDVEF
jgi:hypothetical protein